MSQAQDTMRRLNPNAFVGEEDGCAIMIEDVTDPDGRMYRLEFRATADGSKAIAFCLHNPWGASGQPNAGVEYTEGHVAENGFVCVGSESIRELAKSPYDLEFTVRRARFWCTGFSAFKETGVFPQPVEAA